MSQVCVRCRAVMLQLALQNIMENMKSLCWIYGMFYRFGLINVPDEAKEKMKKAFSKSS